MIKRADTNCLPPIEVPVTWIQRIPIPELDSLDPGIWKTDCDRLMANLKRVNSEKKSNESPD